MVELNVMPEINAAAVHGLFMDDRRYRLADKTIDGDEWAASYLPDYWPATHDLQAVLGTRAAHLGDVSKRRLVNHWRTFYRWATANVAVDRNGQPQRIYPAPDGVLQVTPGLERLANPTLRLPLPRVRRRIARVLSPVDVVMIEAAVRTHNELAIWVCAFGLGMRRGEIWNLTPADVRPGELRVSAAGKTGERIIPLTDRQYEVLSAGHDGEIMWRCETKRVGEPMTYWGWSALMRRLRDRAGVPGGFHDLRATYATRVLEGGASTRTVQQLLGHTSVLTTERYTAPSAAHVRDIHARLNPWDGRDARPPDSSSG
ncbi:MAG: site-specific integrase [Chloroflexi bacterium]|nr:site-specific integrase [Chloroflexota bacterium]